MKSAAHLRRHYFSILMWITLRERLLWLAAYSFYTEQQIFEELGDKSPRLINTDSLPPYGENKTRFEEVLIIENVQ